jgi:hypothetical protein
MKKHVETLALRMQFFHLDPKWDNFVEIIDNKKVCSEQGHVVELWKTACLMEYNQYWPEITDKFPNFNGPETLLKYSNDVQKLMVKFEKRPTSTILDQIWYLYFATGDYNFLKKGFECAGYPAATRRLREDAISMYETIKDQYMDKIYETIQSHPNWFKNHEIPNVRTAQSNWDDMQNEIEGKIAELNKPNDLDDEIDAMIAENKSANSQYKFVPEADIDKTPEELEHDKKLNRGMELFSKLLTDANNGKK